MSGRSPPPSIASLHLPRLLFLHGGGTNAQIFHLQCRSLRAALGLHFRIVFANAPFVTPTPGPDVLSVYASFGPFRRWLRIRHTDEPLSERDAIEAIDAAIEDAIRADDALGATGEWAGLVGFSQGCKIAASLLAREEACQERGSGLSPCQPTHWHITDDMTVSSDSKSNDKQLHRGLKPAKASPRWRFAVLFAGRGPLVDLLPDDRFACQQGLVRANEAGNCFSHSRPKQSIRVLREEDAQEDKLRLPTLHVHGLHDSGLEFHRLMHEEYCPDAQVIEWEGDHRMPISTGDVAAVAKEIVRLAKESKSGLWART